MSFKSGGSVFRGMLQQVQRDWAALNMRSTTRHIMLPLSEDGRTDCLKLKLALRKATEKGIFIVDAFAASAVDYSRDADTAANGGLLGDLLPQGAVRSPALDRACFTCPLGRVAGPIESEFGWHLILVCERTGCRFDEGMTRCVAEPLPDGEGVRSVVCPSESPTNMPKEFSETAPGIVLLWGAVAISGGLLAEVAALLTGKLPS